MTQDRKPSPRQREYLLARIEGRPVCPPMTQAVRSRIREACVAAGWLTDWMHECPYTVTDAGRMVVECGDGEDLR